MIIENTGYHPQIERFCGCEIQLGMLHPDVVDEIRKGFPNADESDLVHVSFATGDWNFVVYNNNLYTMFL